MVKLRRDSKESQNKQQMIGIAYPNINSLSKEDNGMPSNVFDWMSRYNVFDFYSQRETR